MKDSRLWEPVVSQLRHSSPGEIALLAASAECPAPAFGDLGSKGSQRSPVGWDRVVVVEAGDDLLQPFALFGYRLMHPPSQFPCNLLDLRLHAVATGPPLEKEFAPSRLAADEGHAKEIEGLRFAEPALLAFGCRVATELNQAGLFRMQRQREPLQPVAHRIPEAAGISLVLKTEHDIVRITNHDHVARGLAPSPAFGPEIKTVVQVDVGQERRYHRPLPGPLVTDRHDSVFQNARLEPFLNQVEDARVGDPMLQESGQPGLADFIEKASDVNFQYPVHLRAAGSDHQGVQRIVLAALGAEPIRKAEEVLLVNRIQHRGAHEGFWNGLNPAGYKLVRRVPHAREGLALDRNETVDQK